MKHFSVPGENLSDVPLDSRSARSSDFADLNQMTVIIPSLEYSVNSSDLGKNGNLVSDFIKRQRDNPRLQKINLRGYSMSLENIIQFLQFIATCKYVTHIDLSDNPLDRCVTYLAESIRSWGNNPPLQDLDLYNCSLTAAASRELVQSLSTCRQLTELDLGENKLGGAGHQLAQSIRSWGDEPMLQQLYLGKSSLTAAASLELVQSLSTCRQLTKLNLGENMLGEAGHQLAQSIRSWGDEPPLQELQLYKCSLTAAATLELVQSLSMCKKLIGLNLGTSNIGRVEYQLAQSIRSWGDEPMLQQLWLHSCSLTATASNELVQSLSTCKQLTELNLGENMLGEAGHQLAQSIASWGDEPPLQKLWLHNCSLTAAA